MKQFSFAYAFFVLLSVAPIPGFAQESDTFRFPPGLLIPNYNRIPVGQIESSEGGAFVARSSGIIANWYNPAGLALTELLTLNAGSSGYEIIKLKLDGFENAPRSLTANGTPGFIGIVTRLPFKTTKKVRVGLSFGQQSSWQPIFDSNTKLNNAETSDILSIAYKLKFSTSAPTVSFGVNSSSHFRWGAGVQLPFTTLNIYESIGNQILSSTNVVSNLINFRVSGLVIHLLGIGGVQYAFSDRMTAGAVIKTPGLTIWDNSEFSYESILCGIDSSKSIVFHDSSAMFDYRLPFQCSVGIAYSTDYYQLEADLNYYIGAKTYTVIGSNNQVKQISTNMEGAFSINNFDFPDLKYDRNQVFNIALGGHIRISKWIRIHGGIFTDFSPVNPSNSTVFRKINLYGTTLGLSMKSETIGGVGVGIKYSFGRSENFKVGENISPDPNNTHLNVNSFAISWALSLGI